MSTISSIRRLRHSVLASALVLLGALPALAQDRVEIPAPEPQTNGLFGYAVKLDGGRLFVGAPGETTSGTEREGVSWIYEWNGSQWTLTQRILAPEQVAGMSFGRSIDWDGDLMVVGACPTDEMDIPGAAYVYRRVTGIWQFEQRLVSDAPTRRYGFMVQVHDGSIAVADPLRGDGDVHLYRQTAGEWNETTRTSSIAGTPTNPPGFVPSRLGTSIELDGRTLVAGATVGQRAAVYRRGADNAWRHVQTLSMSCASFGINARLSGDTLAISCIGRVYTYRRSDGRFTLEQQFSDSGISNTRLPGYSFDLQGDTIWCSTLVDSQASGRGFAFRYTRKDGVWTLGENLRPVQSGSALFAWNRQSIALDKDNVVVAAHGDDQVLTNAGAISIVRNAGTGTPKLGLAVVGTTLTTAGVATDLAFERLGGEGPVAFEHVAGDLPSTGSLDSASGVLSGVSSAAGIFNFTVEVRDQAGARATGEFTVEVLERPRVITSELPVLARSRPFSTDLVATTPVGQVTWELESGELPSGLTFDVAKGRLSGTPTSAGLFPIWVSAVDERQGKSDPVAVLVHSEAVSDLSRGERTDDIQTGAEPNVFVLELIRGTALDVRVKGARGAELSVEIQQNDGALLDLQAVTHVFRNGLRVRNVEVPATGRYFVRVLASGAPRGLTVRTRVRAPRRARGVLTVEAGQTEVFRVPVLPGARIGIDVRPEKGSSAVPAVTTVRNELGAQVFGTTEFSARPRGRGVIAAATMLLSAGGEAAVFVTAQGVTAGEVRWKARVKQPSVYTFVLPLTSSGN